MRSPDTLTINDVVERLDRFDSIIDARSPSEFENDHLPGAISAPVLSDEERARVGTIYKQQSSFDAKRIGAALVARNIAAHVENLFASKPRNWSPLVYCWRGGNRSSALALVLSRIGWQSRVLEGGYKAFRTRVISDLEEFPRRFSFRVIAGRTGCGKSLILAELARRGAQVLDLEAIASHRGSVLGRMPGEEQPGQKRFETLLWQALRGFDPGQPVYVESESRRIGVCHVPETLMQSIRQGSCITVEASVETRVALLQREYRHFIEDPARLQEQLTRLTEIHGHATLGRWREWAGHGDWDNLVTDLLVAHYDPSYDRSMARNFTRLAEARSVSLGGPDNQSIAQAAERLLWAAGSQP